MAELREAFNLFDTDASGSISTSELGDVLSTLGEPASEEELATIIQEIDKDGTLSTFNVSKSKKVSKNIQQYIISEKEVHLYTLMTRLSVFA